jgi:ribosomal protein S27AE
MSVIQQVRCPNCGSFAERHHLLEGGLTRTQCGDCDYLLVMCSQTNRVIESYAPGISGERLLRNHVQCNQVQDYSAHSSPGQSSPGQSQSSGVAQAAKTTRALTAVRS